MKRKSYKRHLGEEILGQPFCRLSNESEILIPKRLKDERTSIWVYSNLYKRGHLILEDYKCPFQDLANFYHKLETLNGEIPKDSDLEKYLKNKFFKLNIIT